MGLLIIPALVAILGFPGGFASEDALAPFDRVAHERGQTVVVVDATGVQRVGRLLAADASGLTLALGDHLVAVPAGDVWRVDREGDSVKDGFIRGVLFGLVVGAIGSAEADGRVKASVLTGMVATYGLIGAAIDWNVHGRTPVYRAAVKVTF